MLSIFIYLLVGAEKFIWNIPILTTKYKQLIVVITFDSMLACSNWCERTKITNDAVVRTNDIYFGLTKLLKLGYFLI